MGTAIGDLLEKKEIELGELSGKKLGVDSFNIIYQFLSTIRSQDGEPLMDSQGRITSHLTGLFYRTANLLQKEIKPVFVFDGEPHELKAGTRDERKKVKEEARKKLEQARKEGRKEDIKKYAQQTSVLSEEMIGEAKKLIKALGLPTIDAPMDGEAQVAVMVEKGECFGCVSQDYDALLYGTPLLLRNITVTGKRKLPGKNIYIDVMPEKIFLKETLEKLGIDRNKLIWIGILVGTDFNEKFPKIGPKTALELVKKFESFEEIIKETKHEPEFNYEEIEKIFLEPAYSSDYKIEFKQPDRQKIIELLVEEHNFSRERVENTINKISEKIEQQGEQSSLKKWF